MITRRANTGYALSLVIVWSLCGICSFAQSNSDLDRGMAEFRAGNYSSAVRLLASAEATSPGATDALLYRAKSLVHLQDFAGAEQSLRTYLNSHGNSSDALYMLGFVLNRENRPAESLAAYTQAAAITPPTSDDLKIVGLDYVLLNDNADAIKWLEKAVAFDSKNKDAWYYLGRAYYTRSRLNEARKAFQTLLEVDPLNARAENNLGLIYETEGNVNGAIEAYRKAITWQEQIPQVNEQPYVNLGNLLTQQGRSQEAIGPLEKAVALAPNNPYCHLTLGVFYRKMGATEKARRELVRATDLDPNNAVAHYQLGRIYKDLKDLAHAKAEFDRTAALQTKAAGPRSAQTHP
jgi:tetratricopeptide (TPR) repeat protein